MRIIYHHRTASRDGQSTHITEMIGALRAAGHTVIESSPGVSSDPSGDTGGSPGWVGRLKRALPSGLYELAELAYSIVAFRRLAREIKRCQPDGIYERYNLYLLAGGWAKRRFGLKLLLEVNAPMAIERAQYGGLTWPRLARWAEVHVWRQADVILPVTHVLAEEMVALGVDRERIVVIPNAINEAHYLGLPSADEAKTRLGLSGRLVVGFTGFVREWDRLERIVEWVARQSDRYNVHLLVVGDGPSRAGVQDLAQRLGMGDRVTFTGVVPRSRVPELAMAFDIALQTALVPYASPLCLFEYMALGKAIVAPDQDNHREILTAGIDAMLYDPDDPLGIERALDELCHDAELRARIGLAGQRLITQRQLTWRQHAAKVADLFTSSEASR